MRKLATLLGCAILLGGCASVEPRIAASEGAMLADAKARAARHCGKYPQGCEYKISPGSHRYGWSVWVIPIDLLPDGRRVWGFDTDDMYFYDERGQFESALRGY